MPPAVPSVPTLAVTSPDSPMESDRQTTLSSSLAYFHRNINSNLVAGATSGITTTALLHPFDCIKTRFQVHEGISSKAVVPKYSSTLNAFTTIFRHEGIRALYQGVPTAMLGSGIAWGAYFFLYEKNKMYIRQREKRLSGGTWSEEDRNRKLLPWQHMICGASAGVCTVFLTNPIWLIKTRLQLQVIENEKMKLRLPQSISGSVQGPHSSTDVHYRGFLHAVRSIVRYEGATALYKGLVPALFLVSHGAIHFTIYEEFKSLAAQLREDGKMGQYDPLLLGAVSKAVASTLTFPYQTIKARMQRRVYPGEQPYSGTWDCTVRTWRGEGWRGFFKGLAPKTWQIMPQAGITFLLYETIKKFLDDKKGV